MDSDITSAGNSCTTSSIIPYARQLLKDSWFLRTTSKSLFAVPTSGKRYLGQFQSIHGEVGHEGYAH